MAKEKAKHDGLLCFLLALIVVLILVIGGGAYYFLVVDNGEGIANNESENNSIPTNTESNIEKLENKLINLSEAEKKAINKKVDTVEMAYTLGYFLNGNKTLTEEDMLKIAIFWAREEDKNYKDFGGYDIDNNAERTNIDYAKKWVKKVFNKDITINENMEYIKKSDKDLLITDFPTGFGIQVHKMQKLELNEKTNTYSLYIDELNLTELENNGDLVGKLEEIREQIDYSKYKVVNSYVLRYKEVNGEKYIVEILKNAVNNEAISTKQEEIDKIVEKNIKKYIELDDAGTPVQWLGILGIEENALEKYDNNVVDNWMKTDIKYKEFKSEILKYVTENMLKNSIRFSNAIKEEADGTISFVAAFKGGSGNITNIDISLIEQKADLYVYDINIERDWADSIVKHKFKANIKKENSNYLIDSVYEEMEFWNGKWQEKTY